MQKKLHACVAFIRQQKDIRRLLLVQLALVSACAWLGLIIHQLQAAETGLLLLLLAVPLLAAVAVSPLARCWLGSLVPAAGLMFVFSQILPAGWSQGPLFVLMAFGCAALGMQISRRPVGIDDPAD